MADILVTLASKSYPMESQVIDQLIDALLVREGGYVDHPNDRGGPTNMGVTLATLAAFTGAATTADDVKALTRKMAGDVYRDMYWRAPGFDQLGLTHVLTEMVFDAGVHHGPGRATKLLQSALGVTADGVLGPVTRSMAKTLPPIQLAARFMGARLEYLGKIVTNDPRQAVFAAGWMRRVAGLVYDIPRAAI